MKLIFTFPCENAVTLKGAFFNLLDCIAGQVKQKKNAWVVAFPFQFVRC